MRHADKTKKQPRQPETDAKTVEAMPPKIRVNAKKMTRINEAFMRGEMPPSIQDKQAVEDFAEQFDLTYGEMMVSLCLQKRI